MSGMSRTGRGRGRARAEVAVVRVLEKRLGALPVVAEFGRRLRIAEIVDELCPVRPVAWISHAPCPRPPRRVQAGPAPRAFRRRRHFLPLVRVRGPRQPRPGMPRLPAALAVLAPFPFRGLAGLPLSLASLTRPDRVLRRRHSRGRALRPQPPLQFRDPQLQPPVPLQLSAQHRVLGVLGPRSRPAAGRPAHADPRCRQAHQAHRTQTPSMLTRCQRFKYPGPRAVSRAQPECRDSLGMSFPRSLVVIWRA